MTTDVPVAFVVFNRPANTRISFDRIRRYRPRRLFLIGDAAREDRPGECELVEQSREIAAQVDWDCDLTKIYASQNMGCGKRISSGIDEAFREVDRLIVLEDDCVADETFFPFCAELLDRYEFDERVMAVTGNNFQGDHRRTSASYYFSKYPHCWGWATWRRAWKHFDLAISAWPEIRDSGQFEGLCQSKREYDYWTTLFNRVHVGDSQSWAFPWTLACWINSGLTATPDFNLVTNIGFGSDATHTNKRNDLESVPAASIENIRHPSFVHPHFAADRYVDQTLFSVRGSHRMTKKLEDSFRRFRRSLRRVG